MAASMLRAAAAALLPLLLLATAVQGVTTRLYAIDNGGDYNKGLASSWLYELSTIDGSVLRTVGNTQVNLTAIGWNPVAGQLWATGGRSALFVLDTTTANLSYLVTLSPPHYLTQLAFDSRARLMAWDETASCVVEIDYTTGVVTPFSEVIFGQNSGVTFTDNDELWVKGAEHLYRLNTTTGAATEMAELDRQEYSAGGFEYLPVGLGCAPNDVCYVLLGDGTQSRLGIINITTGQVDATGVNTRIVTLISAAVLSTTIYVNAPLSATQGVARALRMYAEPAYQTPFTFTIESSSNSAVLPVGSLSLSTVDDATQDLVFTGTTQGTTHIVITAVDRRGRTFRKTFALAVLPSPRLTQPPSAVVAWQSSTRNVTVHELHQLDGTTVTATTSNSTIVRDLRVVATDAPRYAIVWSTMSYAGEANVVVSANNVFGGTHAVSFDVTVPITALCQ